MDNTSKPAVAIQLSPVTKSFQLEPGKIVEDTFTVQNVGAETFSYKLYASPYNILDDEYNADFTSESKFSQIYHWATFKATDGTYSDEVVYTIAPGELQEITLRLTPPTDLPEGSQHAIIFAESLKRTTSNGVSTVSRVGLNLRGIALGETHETAAITNWTAPSYLASGNITSSVTIKNTGNVDVATGYDYVIRDQFGNIVYENNNAYDIFADTNRRFDFEWEETPLMGIYKIELTIAAAGDTEHFYQTTVVMPPIVAAIAIGIISFFVVMTMLFIRKRRSRAIVY